MNPHTDCTICDHDATLRLHRNCTGSALLCARISGADHRAEGDCHGMKTLIKPGGRLIVPVSSISGRKVLGRAGMEVK